MTDHSSSAPAPSGEVARLQARVAELEEALAAQSTLAAALARSEARLTVLADASRLFAAAYSGLDALLQLVARYVAYAVGEACVVQLLSADGAPTRSGYAAHRDPAGQPLAEALAGQIARVKARRLRAALGPQQPLLIPVVTQATVAARLGPQAGQELSLLGVRSLVMVLLQDHGTPIGLLTVARGAEGAPPYDTGDLVMLQDLADRAALAISQSRAISDERASRALLDTFFSSAPVGLAFVDRELRFMRVNSRLAEINGPNPAEHIGRKVEEVVPDLAPQLIPIYRRVLETGEAVTDLEVHGTVPGAPGQPRVWLVSYYPVQAPGSGASGVGVVVFEITARKQAEAQLARQAEALREQAETLELAHVIIRDVDSRIVYWNQGAEALYGWSPAEALGQVSHELFQTRFPASLEATQAELFGTGLWEGELVHRRKDGGELVVASHQVLHHDAEGRPMRILEVNNDITALKRAEEELRRRDEQLRVAHDVADIGTWQHDLSSDLVFFDERASAHYGLAHPAAPLADVLSQIHPDDAARVRGQIAALVATTEGAQLNIEYRVLHPEGPLRWVSVHARRHGGPVSGGSSPSLVIGTSQDITQRKETEEMLRRSAERLRILHAIDGSILSAQQPESIARAVVTQVRQLVACERASVLTYDTERRVLRVLAVDDAQGGRYEAGETIPVAPQDLLPPYPLGQPWYITDAREQRDLPPRAVDHLAIGLRALLHLPLVAEGEMLGVLRLSAAAPQAFTRDDIAIAEEVADQLAIALRSAALSVQLERERASLARRVAERTVDLSAANAELARAARLKDEFLANMSHELRTPLNAILGRAELLREQIYGQLTSRQDGAIQSIEEAGRHLLALINDILDLSKVEAGMLSLEHAVVDVEELGRAAVRLVAEAAVSKQIAVTTDYDSLAREVVADERRLKQILVNLLSNAVKFTPRGGSVGLEVRGDPEREQVAFTVWDTGIGIAPEDQQRLFRPFVQIDSALSRQQSGTGLGLALVQRLTELHGGSVILESNPGAGSRFQVVLPWDQRGHVQVAGAPDETEAEALPLAIRDVLVIDDSPAAADQVAGYLKELGSRVLIHDRAEGALEQAALTQPDVIILDILLPRQSGWELLRQLKADPRTAAIPVLVASVIDDPASARALGASGALVKPVARPELVRALQALRPAAVAPAQTALVVAPDARLARPLVLLADDNAENLRVLADYLKAAGFDVITAHTGAEAVAHAEQLRPEVILMDVQMPVVDGLEATRRIRAAGLRDTPIIVVTALAMRGDRERCLEAGADAYLTKPVSLRILRATMERLIQGRGARGGRQA